VTAPSDYLGGMLARFEEAERRAGAAVRELRVAGRGVRLRFAGEGLLPRVMPALAHLLGEAAPSLTVCLWDTASTGVRMLPPPFAVGAHMPPSIEGFTGPRHHAWFRVDLGMFSLIDVEAGVAVVWARDPALIDRHDAAAPLKAIFSAAWAGDGVHLVHAAAVGDERGGALLGGPGGSGKSTTAVLCLAAGMGYAGDDYVLCDTAAGWAHSVYATAKLAPSSVAWVPELAPAFDAPSPGEKSIAYLGGRAGLRDGFPLRAMILPSVTAVGRTRLVPIAPATAVRRLAPSSVLQTLGAGDGMLAGLVSLARRLPCYALELGADREAVPSVVAGALAW
jgi:hypothetical protein